ncbi:MAG: bifunctional histidinol-phosphatase/imidazoleglycerol-phosphate dehydratase HisB [Chiayiivirga sp.]|jgi:imidazoleglycerol-phosphate dehydratase/histidinol-phosphatase|uniref:bifunctional histidinol-phosphatase/imidazoleglycerol-phosphate dehydratase HisB n=1 Tax=Chiayiivirga sp. TaxID=2041042 RepID=UPI0025BB16DC|nr:bifunctional histidinol-phosphatase/imidazoleglycerol-phosphate dehydratase HisB [Chiayiivirga sp.]MCI1730266.1 bifunctional histidinol-phosphatase/imidazoleglycerol-phosphate dehydratase HisB [Chiayiivirga sp.]
MRRLLFIDRDGTLIEEPADFQIDSYAKLRFVEGMIPALIVLRDAGYEFVLVSNQDGLGTASFPREDFVGPHRLLIQLLESQGIRFLEELIDESFPHQNLPTRKPGVGMLLPYLRDRSIDLAHSAVIGDRETDLQLAKNLGCRGFRLGPGLATWQGIAHELANAPRTARVERNTGETRILVDVDLDRVAEPEVATGLGFFDHMLEQLGKHGGFAAAPAVCGRPARGRASHREDSALALGQAMKQASGDKRGIARYGSEALGDDAVPIAFALPMDEALASAVLDFSGRPYFVFDGAFARAEVGGLATELVPHFFRSLCESAGLNLHLCVRGSNAHHQVEACFKVVARALRLAIRREGRELPSTKGML